jgi:hypothetical protein
MESSRPALWLSIAALGLVVIFVSCSHINWRLEVSEKLLGSTSGLHSEIYHDSSVPVRRQRNESSFAVLAPVNGSTGDFFSIGQTASEEERLLASYQRADLSFDPNGPYGLFGPAWNARAVVGNGLQYLTTYDDVTGTWENPATLVVRYPAGAYAHPALGGLQFQARPFSSKLGTSMSLSYSVYVPPDFNFVRGGKLPGLFGGM